MLSSSWYQERLQKRRWVEHTLWTRHVRYLERLLKRKTHAAEAQRLGISQRLDLAVRSLQESDSDSAIKRLRGTIGTQPIAPVVSAVS